MHSSNSGTHGWDRKRRRSLASVFSRMSGNSDLADLSSSDFLSSAEARTANLRLGQHG